MAGVVRRTWWWLLAAAVLLIVFVVVWFEPQALFVDRVVDEALPTTAGDADPGTEAPDDGPTTDPTAAEPSPSTTTPPPTTTDLAEGTFTSLGRYTTTGQLRVVELADGRRVVRLEDFATDNGPDLLVYLSTAPADGSGDFAAEFVDLGELRGNIGDQNYALPPDVDLDGWRSVVIWCRRFSTAFGAANLVPAA